MVKKELESYEKGWSEQIMDGAVEVIKNMDAVAGGLEDFSNAI